MICQHYVRTWYHTGTLEAPIERWRCDGCGFDSIAAPGDTAPRGAEDELKRCPFCGGHASIIEVEEPSNVGGYVVQCADCDEEIFTEDPMFYDPDGDMDGCGAYIDCSTYLCKPCGLERGYDAH